MLGRLGAPDGGAAFPDARFASGFPKGTGTGSVVSTAEVAGANGFMIWPPTPSSGAEGAGVAPGPELASLPMTSAKAGAGARGGAGADIAGLDAAGGGLPGPSSTTGAFWSGELATSPWGLSEG